MQVTLNGRQINGPARLIAAAALINQEELDADESLVGTAWLTPKQVKRVRKYVRRHWLYTVEHRDTGWCLLHR